MSQRKHALEMKQAKEKLMIEQDELKGQLLKQAQDQHIEMQRKIREEMVRERNKEIEAIIEKLGDETHSTQKSLLASYEQKVTKIEEKHRSELNDYKKLLDNTKDKLLNETQTREMLDENLRVLTRRINDLEIELSDKKEKIVKLDRATAHS